MSDAVAGVSVLKIDGMRTSEINGALMVVRDRIKIARQEANDDELDALLRAGLKLSNLALITRADFSLFNARGSLYRAVGKYECSEADYRASLEVQPDAEVNPYGYIGLAATLRRLSALRRDAWDEAYDLIKRAAKYYPDNEYLCSVRGALLADREVANSFAGEMFAAASVPTV